jgi:hypothetical protein
MVTHEKGGSMAKLQESGVAPMKVAQVPKAGGDFEIVEREIPKPGAGQVLIKVQACGICHKRRAHEEWLARHSVSARSRA